MSAIHRNATCRTGLLAHPFEKLIHRINSVARINHAGAAPHQDGHAECVSELLSCCSGFDRIVNVVGDAIIAPMCDADCQCHQLPGLPVEGARGSSRIVESPNVSITAGRAAARV